MTTYDPDARWWQNRANRYAEQVENLQNEVAYQTAIVDRVTALRDTYRHNPNRASPCIIADLDEALGEVPDGS